MRCAIIAWLLAFAARTTAACTNTTRSDCATSEDCAVARGCAHNSPGDYDRTYCVAGSEEGASLDGCAGSLGIGAIGGVFAFILPCCVLCSRRRRQHSQWMLAAPDTAMKRAIASAKWGLGAESGGGTLQVVPQAMRSDGGVLNADAPT